MTFVMGLASLGLTFISIYQAPVGWTYACLFAAGAARTFLWPASSAFLPHLVSREDFSKAVTWSAGSFNLSSVTGPAAGGALIVLAHQHAAPVYALNACASLLCLALISFVHRDHTVASKQKLTAANLIGGFEFVVANRIILGTISLDMFAVLLGGAIALLPVYAKDILHAGPSGLGILQAALPAGSLFCGLVMAHRPPLQKAGRAMLWAVATFGLTTIVFGLSPSFGLHIRIFGFLPSFWFSFFMLFLAGLADNISVVVRHTLVQMLTPDEKRGRVSAVTACSSAPPTSWVGSNPAWSRT